MALQFKKAQKSQAKLRLALTGPAGSGKTFTALAIGTNLGKRLGVIDSERGSASLYADRFSFEALDLPDTRPETYLEALKAAAAEGLDVVVIDSWSHAWESLKDRAEPVAKAKYKGNTWSAWSELTPVQNALVDAILKYPGHVICCMRTKTAWEVEKDERTGKSKPVKVGLAPIQREGVDYEFTIVLEMSDGGIARVSKTRMDGISERVIQKPGKEFANELLTWLNSGAPVAATPFNPTVPAPPVEVEREDTKALATRRDILLEKVEAAMVETWPGQSAEAKRAKLDALRTVFGTTSWTEVKGLHPDILAVKLDALQKHIHGRQPAPPVAVEAPPIQMSVTIEAEVPEREDPEPFEGQ
jgi:hypothetical protein